MTLEVLLCYILQVSEMRTTLGFYDSTFHRINVRVYTYIYLSINILTLLVYLSVTDSNSLYICFNTFNSCPQEVDTWPSLSLISGYSLYLQPASDTLEALFPLCLDHDSSLLDTPSFHYGSTLAFYSSRIGPHVTLPCSI